MPRMETEQMVGQILDRFNDSFDGHVVDLGTAHIFFYAMLSNIPLAQGSISPKTP